MCKDKIQPLAHNLKLEDKTVENGTYTYRLIRFVSVRRCIYIWDERRQSASRVKSAWNRKRDSQSKLRIQISLDPWITLVILAAFYIISKFRICQSPEEKIKGSEAHR
jgi:hypothetical protein